MFLHLTPNPSPKERGFFIVFLKVLSFEVDYSLIIFLVFMMASPFR